MAPPPSTGTTGPRIVKRVALTLFAFVTAGLLVAIFTRMSPLSEHYLPAMREVMSLSSPLSSSLSGKESPVTTPLVSSCTRENATHNPLTGLDANYAHLMDDKFTQVLPTGILCALSCASADLS